MKTQSLNPKTPSAIPGSKNIVGTFSPALGDNCHWHLWAPDGTVISSGVVADHQKEILAVALPEAPMQGDYCLKVHEAIPAARVVNQSGGMVIIENVEIEDPKDSVGRVTKAILNEPRLQSLD